MSTYSVVKHVHAPDRITIILYVNERTHANKRLGGRFTIQFVTNVILHIHANTRKCMRRISSIRIRNKYRSVSNGIYDRAKFKRKIFSDSGHASLKNMKYSF